MSFYITGISEWKILSTVTPWEEEYVLLVQCAEKLIGVAPPIGVPYTLLGVQFQSVSFS